MFDIAKGREIVLASASPRRLELLRQIDIEPRLLPVDVDERQNLAEHLPPHRLVMLNAELKAAAAAALAGEALIVAADTVVIMDGALLGKPADQQAAASMLRRLSGNKHQVYTGICIIDGATNCHVSGYSCTDVEFLPLSEQMIADYIATGEPMDKAGAYGIQGRGGLFVKQISGDYGTVVGLSLPLLWRLISECLAG